MSRLSAARAVALLGVVAVTALAGCNLPPAPSRWSNEVAYELSRPRLTIASGLGSTPLDWELAQLERDERPDSPKLVAMLHHVGRRRIREGRLDEADAIFQQLVSVAEQKVDAGDPYWVILGQDLAQLELARGNYAEARRHLEACLVIARERLSARRDIEANVLVGLAAADIGLWQFALADSELARAAELARQRGSSAQLVGILRAQGNLFRLTGRPNEAQQALERALELASDQGGAASTEVALIRGQLASVAMARGELQQAAAGYGTAISMLEAQGRVMTPGMAQMLLGKAQVHGLLGELREAAELQLRAYRIAARFHGADHPVLVQYGQALAQTWLQQGEYERAYPVCTRSLADQSARYGAQHLATVAARNCVASLCAVDGQRETARALAHESMQIVFASTGDNTPIAFVLAGLFEVYVDPRDQDEVQAFLERAAALVQRAYGADHPATVPSRRQLAEIHIARDEYPGALEILQAATRVAWRTTGAESLLSASLALTTARAELGTGALEEAAAGARRAEAIYRWRLGDSHPAVAMALSLRSEILATVGDFAAATRLAETSSEILQRARPSRSLCGGEDDAI